MATHPRPQSDDEACGRLWEVYVQEAQQYDEGLVKSWKEDMDVTLVFSGLYSAVLTAFVVESYQKLQEDPSDASALLLQQISEQLSSLSTGQNVTQSISKVKFSPSSSAVACNVLWFMSLLLAISCAFLATFVQQWSRQFLHKTGLLRSSTAHARLFSFLYIGLKDFGMHTIVNVIPSLLHLSLFLFLGGLVAFMHEVNTAITWLVIAVLSVVTFAYLGFTIWPVIALNSPYQTPFSPVAWKAWQVLARSIIPVIQNTWATSEHTVSRAIIHVQHVATRPILPIFSYSLQTTQSTRRRMETVMRSASSYLPNPFLFPMHGPDSTSSGARVRTLNLSGEVIDASQKDSAQRDTQCISWVLSSLTDDVQLLPFVEALPDAVYGPNGLREGNFYLVKPILETSDPQLDVISRISSLMVNAGNPWFDTKHRERCVLACSRALWVLAFMLTERPLYFDLTKTSRTSWFPKHVRDTLLNIAAPAPLKHPYAVSALALCELNVTAYLYNRIQITGYAQPNIDPATQALLDEESHDQSPHPNKTSPTSAMDLETIAATRCHRAISMFLQVSSDELAFEYERTSHVVTKFLARHNRLGAFIPVGPVGIDKLTPRLDENELSLGSKIPMYDSIVTIWLHLAYKRDPDIVSAVEYIAKRAKYDGWTSTEKIWKASPRGSKALLALLMNSDSIPINTSWCNAVREYLYIHIRLQSSEESVYNADKLEDFWTTFALKLADGIRSSLNEPPNTSWIALVTMIAMRATLVDTYADSKLQRPSGSLTRLFEYIGRFEPAIGDAAQMFSDGPSLDMGVKASRVAALSTQLLRRFQSSVASPDNARNIRDALEYILYTLGRNGPFEGAVIKDATAEEFSEYAEQICQWWKDAPSEEVNWDIPDIIMIVWQIWHSFEEVSSRVAAQHLKNAADLICSGEARQKIRRLQRRGRGSTRRASLPMGSMVFNPYFVEEIIKDIESQCSQILTN